jgi:[CysO sulfur-carrier protein]-S-L-cysteine hydrolase
MLRITADIHTRMVALAYDQYPLEACGLLGGDPATGEATLFYPCANVAASAKVYSIDGREHLRAERDAEDRGLEIIGVMHSHTHTEAYPSPTDINQAPDPTWHYLIVSLKRDIPVVRSYYLVDATVEEEPVLLAAETGE